MRNSRIYFLLLLCYAALGANATEFAPFNLCANDQITLAPPAESGGTWVSSAPSIATVGSSGVVTGIAAGSAVITYTYGGTAHTAIATIVDPFTHIYGLQTICAGARTQLVGAPYYGSGTWSSSNSAVASIGSAGESGAVLTGVAAGTAVITYAITGCTTTTTVTVPAVLSAAIKTFSVTDPGLIKVCEKSVLDLKIDPAPDPEDEGVWSSTATNIITVGTAGTIYGVYQQSGDPATADIQYITDEGCATANAALTILPRITAPINVCKGSTVIATIDGGGSGEWGISEAGLSLTDDPTDEYKVAAYGDTEGPIKIMFVRPNTFYCAHNVSESHPMYVVDAGNSIAEWVPVPGADAALFFAKDGYIKVCMGQDVILNAIAHYGSWSSTPDLSGTTSGVHQDFYSFTAPNYATTSTVTFVSTTNVCTTTVNVMVVDPSDPITGGDNLIVGQSAPLSHAISGGTWSSSNEDVATIGTSGVVLGVAPGTTTISYQTTRIGCYQTKVVTVLAPSYDAIICEGGDLHLMANDAGGNTYLWSGPLSFTSTEQNPVITGVTAAAAGIYSLSITTAASVTATYTLAVTIGSNASYSIAVTQTVPFLLYGDKVHTYATGGFTLRVDGTPALPATGVTYTWAGAVPSTSSSPLFSPAFTPSGSVSIKPYTVTAAYNGCVLTIPDTIIVPPASCSPYDYFSVGRYRTANSLPAIAGCADCADVQPFHTITGSRLTAANVADNSNYYVLNTVVCEKPELTNDNFFMNTATIVFVEENTSVDIDHCHFFSTNTCWWRGIYVQTSAEGVGHLNIHGNTLIENAGGVAHTTHNALFPSGVVVMPGGGYYDSEMADILNSESVIYNKNYIGVSLYEYQPSVASTEGEGGRLPYTIKNCVFSNKELAGLDDATTALGNYPFSWPSVANLKAVISEDVIPSFGLDQYKGSTGVNQGKNGIFTQNIGSHEELTAGSATVPATYKYNYLHLGEPASDGTFTNTNLFDSLTYPAVELQRTNVQFHNNTFRSILISGIKILGSIHDCQVIRDAGETTNNRFYNCGFGLWSAGDNTNTPFDITCSQAEFIAKNGTSTGLARPVIANYLVFGGQPHNLYNIDKNTIFNYEIGVEFQSVGGGPIALNGQTNITDNIITGKTSNSGTENMVVGIEVWDARGAAAANGNVLIEGNTVTGATTGIRTQSTGQVVDILHNTIYPYQYGTTLLAGISAYRTPYHGKIQSNAVLGNACNSNSWGITLLNLGLGSNRVEVSCNTVEKMKVGFDFRDVSNLNWHNNIMRCNNTGMQISNGGVIGTQGSPTDPSDNVWDYDDCSSSNCGLSPMHTYLFNSYASASVLYVRTGALYKPTQNYASAGYSPYLSPGTLATATGTLASDPCGSAASRGSDDNAIPQKAMTAVMTIYPNPGNGRFTIVLPTATDGLVTVRILSSVGTQVYTNSYTCDGNNSFGIDLQSLATGTYMIQLTTANGQKSTAKLMIAR